MAFELQRTGEGLLYGPETYTRDPGDTAVPADHTVTSGTWSVDPASDVLKEISAATYGPFIYINSIANRADAYVQATLLAGGLQGGLPAILMRGTGIADANRVEFFVSGSIDAGVTGRYKVMVGGADVATNDLAPNNLSAARINCALVGGTARMWRNGTLRITQAGIASNAGRIGIVSARASGSDPTYFDDLLVCKSPTLTASGLPEGYKIRAGGVTSSESDGSADVTLDIGGLALPLTDLVVLDDADATAYAFDGDVYGGDDFEWTDPDPPFLQVGSIIVLVSAEGASETEPEMGGQVYRTYGGSLRSTERWRKRTWQFTSIEMSEDDYQALVDEVAPPGLVSCYGRAMNGAEVACHVRITAAPYARQRDGLPPHKRTVSLAIREV